MHANEEGLSLSEVIKPSDGSLLAYQATNNHKSSVSNMPFEKTKTAEFHVSPNPNELEYAGK